ncbi:MAG: L-aspartate oxidase [Epsilonproteobacteria bacterium]|nr:L-aspartate oxidase [Campylobacterota bacterium]
MKIYDAIIIGAGIAGLNAAAKFPKDKNVLVICKDNSWDCNTFYAQGGVAVPYDEEDIPLHIEDTMTAGGSLCDREAVEVLCRDGRVAVDDLIDRGFAFDKDDEGKLHYTKEAAHSKNRILHAGGDATGRCMHHFLMRENIHGLLYNSTVTDLLLEDDVCHGVRVYHKGEFRNYYAKATIIASGGVGSIYKYHTNARTISGEMQGLVLEKGCKLRDMEMMQFHPTVFIHNMGARKQLLTEALRGEGAWIVDDDGKRFLFEYDKRGPLSPRNIVSSSIFDWKKRTGLQTYLTFQNFEERFFQRRFPTIHSTMKDLGFRLPFDEVPISPAFHYAMGGIETDINGKLPNMQNLYAIGEVANTRVHGANRLASNSLLEGLVFSKRAVEEIAKQNFNFEIKIFTEEEEVLVKEGDKAIKNELRELMWENAGIMREVSKLELTLKRINEMLSGDIGKLLRLRLKTSRNIVESAIYRKESLGAHYLIK